VYFRNLLYCLAGCGLPNDAGDGGAMPLTLIVRAPPLLPTPTPPGPYDA